MVVMGQRLERLVGGLKSRLMKIKSFKGKQQQQQVPEAMYGKMEKTESMRVEIKSRKAKKLIAKNLKIADSISSKPSSFVF